MQQAFIASSTSFNGSMKIPLPTLTYITNIVMYVVDFRILVNLVFYEELPYKQKLKWHAVWIIKKKRGLENQLLYLHFSAYSKHPHILYGLSSVSLISRPWNLTESCPQP